MTMKMNTLLGVVDHAQTVAAKEISDYTTLFKSKQGQFIGELKTYEPHEGFSDKPSEHSDKKVATTVSEQFNYMLNDKDAHTGALPKYLKLLFQIEATNSVGAKRVPLVVDGVLLGNLTAVELMRLKNILTMASLDEMFKNIPVRSDSKRWTKSETIDYASREVYETDVIRSVDRTTVKTQEILKDPNIDPKCLPANYRAAIVERAQIVEMADQTRQEFSGEWTQTQRAFLLSRKSLILDAVIAALKEVNDTESVEANLDIDKMLSYLFFGAKN